MVGFLSAHLYKWHFLVALHLDIWESIAFPTISKNRLVPFCSKGGCGLVSIAPFLCDNYRCQYANYFIEYFVPDCQYW
jgi:hypothetical protein